MTVYIAVGFAAAAVLWLIIWSVKGLLLTPVRLGRNTDADIVLHIRGAEPTIEYTLRSLMWLRETERSVQTLQLTQTALTTKREAYCGALPRSTDA